MSRKELWVFGYGSLLWEPGFEVAEKVVARMHGFHRSFCMRSIHHRGTNETPGLVLALDRSEGAHCDGPALRAAPGSEASTLEYLRERELISSAYLEVELDIALSTGRDARATCYVIDPDHEQYCGGMEMEEQAQIIACAVGGRGPNWEYLQNTSDQLSKLGLADPDLDWLSNRVTALRAK